MLSWQVLNIYLALASLKLKLGVGRVGGSEERVCSWRQEAYNITSTLHSYRYCSPSYTYHLPLIARFTHLSLLSIIICCPSCVACCILSVYTYRLSCFMISNLYRNDQMLQVDKPWILKGSSRLDSINCKVLKTEFSERMDFWIVVV